MAENALSNTADDPWLFPLGDIPEVATPVNESAPEWQDAMTLKIAESIRFNPERLADYEARIAIDAPGVNAVEFLDYMIERAGGRSQ